MKSDYAEIASDAHLMMALADMKISVHGVAAAVDGSKEEFLSAKAVYEAATVAYEGQWKSIMFKEYNSEELALHELLGIKPNC